MLAPSTAKSGIDVPNGLSNLLLRDMSIASMTTESYKEFAPDLWASIESEAGGNHVVIEFLSVTAQSEAEPDTRISRLRIHPVVGLKKSPAWISLETLLDKKALKGAQGLRIDLVSSFDFGIGMNASQATSLKLVLRKHHRGQDVGFVDQEIGFVPVTNVPFEHSRVVSSLFNDGLNPAEFERIILLILLPVATPYTGNIYHFSVSRI